MGCFHSQAMTQNTSLPPKPKGPAIDPLTYEGDIVQAITKDPHIQFYTMKIQQSIKEVQQHKKSQKQKPQAPQKAHQLQPIKKKAAGTAQKFATSDQSEYQEYVETVNKALEDNEESVTNILQYMIDKVGDFRDADHARQKFVANQSQDDPYAALKCFVYLYTGHYSYKSMNSQLRRSQYDKISKVIAVVQKQLIKYNQESFSRKLKANLKHGKILELYRGIPRPDKKLRTGQKLFWKGFTSTSLNTSVASRFGHYTYKISLDSSNPHPYMIVPESMSQFKQQQIIIFPYFYFTCSNAQIFNNGGLYQCKQLPPKEEEQPN